MKRRDFLRMTALCAGATVLDLKAAGNVYAKQIYPNDKITWIADTAPGGAFDMIPRAMAPFLTKQFQKLAPGCKGGGIVIKNEPSGGGVKALTSLYQAKPNGYIVGGMDSAYVVGMMIGKIKFDVTKYTYLTRFSQTSKVVFTSKNGFKSWDEAIKASQKLPLKISVGKFGGQSHLAAVLLKDALKLNAELVNALGTSGTLSMVIRGDVPLGVVSEDNITDLVNSKELRVLFALRDTTEYPGVVSLNELGFEEYSALSSGQRFVVGPPNLPKETTALLINAIKGVFEDKGFKEWAKKGRYNFNPVYGDDALNVIKRYVSIFNKKEDLLKKNIM